MEEQASNTTIGCLTIGGVFLCLAATAALLYPIFGRTHCYGERKSSCACNLKEVAIALKMYADDNRDCLPSSLIRDPKTKSFIPEFCTEISSSPGKPVTAARSYADVLNPYIKSRELFFCPSDHLDSHKPNTLVSYIYRPAIDQAAVSGYGKEKDFAHPAAQMVLFERLGFHGGQRGEGWNKGVKLNCAFMDSHVAFVGAPDATISGVPRADIPDEPGPALNKALNQPGWPCWFNYDAKTETGVKRRAWDPPRYKDMVN